MVLARRVPYSCSLLAEQNRIFTLHANKTLSFLLLIHRICTGVEVHWILPHWTLLAFWRVSAVWLEYCCSFPQWLNWSLLWWWWHFPGVAAGSGHLILWRLRPSYRTTPRSHTRFTSPMKQNRWALTCFPSPDHISSHDVLIQEHMWRHLIFLPLLCVTRVLLSHRHLMWEQTPKSRLCVRILLPNCSCSPGKVSASLWRLQTR